MTKAKWFETKVSGINGYLKGRKIQLATGNNGVPLDPFWKARFEEKGIVAITPVKRIKADEIETKVVKKPVEKIIEKVVEKPVKKLVEKKTKKQSDKKPKRATRKRGR